MVNERFLFVPWFKLSIVCEENDWVYSIRYIYRQWVGWAIIQDDNVHTLTRTHIHKMHTVRDGLVKMDLTQRSWKWRPDNSKSRTNKTENKLPVISSTDESDHFYDNQTVKPVVLIELMWMIENVRANKQMRRIVSIVNMHRTCQFDDWVNFIL